MQQRKDNSLNHNSNLLISINKQKQRLPSNYQSSNFEKSPIYKKKEIKLNVKQGEFSYKKKNNFDQYSFTNSRILMNYNNLANGKKIDYHNKNKTKSNSTLLSQDFKLNFLEDSSISYESSKKVNYSKYLNNNSLEHRSSSGMLNLNKYKIYSMGNDIAATSNKNTKANKSSSFQPGLLNNISLSRLTKDNNNDLFTNSSYNNYNMLGNNNLSEFNNEIKSTNNLIINNFKINQSTEIINNNNPNLANLNMSPIYNNNNNNNLIDPNNRNSKTSIQRKNMGNVNDYISFNPSKLDNASNSCYVNNLNIINMNNRSNNNNNNNQNSLDNSIDNNSNNSNNLLAFYYCNNNLSSLDLRYFKNKPQFLKESRRMLIEYLKVLKPQNSNMMTNNNNMNQNNFIESGILSNQTNQDSYLNNNNKGSMILSNKDSNMLVGGNQSNFLGSNSMMYNNMNQNRYINSYNNSNTNQQNIKNYNKFINEINDENSIKINLINFLSCPRVMNLLLNNKTHRVANIFLLSPNESSFTYGIESYTFKWLELKEPKNANGFDIIQLNSCVACKDDSNQFEICVIYNNDKNASSGNFFSGNNKKEQIDNASNNINNVDKKYFIIEASTKEMCDNYIKCLCYISQLIKCKVYQKNVDYSKFIYK